MGHVASDGKRGASQGDEALCCSITRVHTVVQRMNGWSNPHASMLLCTHCRTIIIALRGTATCAVALMLQALERWNTLTAVLHDLGQPVIHDQAT